MGIVFADFFSVLSAKFTICVMLFSFDFIFLHSVEYYCQCQLRSLLYCYTYLSRKSFTVYLEAHAHCVTSGKIFFIIQTERYSSYTVLDIRGSISILASGRRSR